MAEEQYPQEQISYELALRLRDLESGQKLTKERLLLIGQNLIESQEKNIKDITELKREMDEIQSDMKRIKEIITSISEEVSKSARKEEISILRRQFKMFEPLNFARIEDIDKIINEKLNKHESLNKGEENETHHFWRGKV